MSAADAIGGTWAMARGDKDWADRLPMDAGAVFASFWAIPLSLPAVVLISEAARQFLIASDNVPDDPAGPVATAIGAVIAAIVTWIACVALLARLASKADAGWRISPLIVGYNWSRLIVNVAGGLGCALAIGLSVWPLMGLFLLGAMGLGVWMEMGVYRRALALSGGQAVGVLLLVLLVRFAANAFVSVVFSAF